jgi:NAD(P)-dependent dehydrogenase (short-subunit alcohol dehydrogenase family)
MLIPLRACIVLALCALVPLTVAAADEPTVLITGASRGIGLELARQYARRGWNVIATARNPAAASELVALASGHPNVVVETLDVTDHAQIDALAAKHRDRPIDVLLNNAGINADKANAKFGAMKYEAYYAAHAVNVVGPVKMAEAFLPNVAASTQKKIINITSGQGSIASIQKTGGCCLFYRSSKAALNMIMRGLALELKPKGITVGLISPGFVKTGMTAGVDFPFMLTAAQSAAAIIRVIDGYDLAKTGTFLEQDGSEWPW